MLIFGIGFIALIVTNPSELDHKNSVKNRILEILKNENDDSKLILNTLGDNIIDSIVIEITDHEVFRKNYYLMSVTKFKSSSVNIGEGIGGKNKIYNGIDVDLQIGSLVSKVIEVSKKIRATKEFIIGKTITIGNLIIAANDFQDRMSLSEGVNSCEELGSGWRLPTIDELELLYSNREKIGGFSKDLYWSSSFDFDAILGEESYYFSFFTGNKGLYYNVSEKYSIRAVKDN